MLEFQQGSEFFFFFSFLFSEKKNKAAISAIMLEADLLSSLDHKNIVKNLEVDQTEDHIFFVMELISRLVMFFGGILGGFSKSLLLRSVARCTRRCKSSER